MKIEIKKNDFVLIVIIISIALCSFLLHHLLQGKGAGQVVVRVSGAIEATYDLNDDLEIELNDGTNIMQINNGKVKMIEADCPDQLCVKQRAISKNKESIICLPNEVIIEIQSTDESQFDGMTN